MSTRRCPFCNSELPDNVTVCPHCGRDTEVTVRADSPGFENGRLVPLTPPRPSNRKGLKVMLLVLAVVFVAADVALYFYYRNQRIEREEREEQERLAAIELAEQRRQDSIAAVEREQARQDSIRQAEETKSKFVKPANVISLVTATGISEESGDPIVIPAYYLTPDLGSAIKSRGYLLISHTKRQEGLVGDEMEVHSYVYGLNCEWDGTNNVPINTNEPWSCVVIREQRCGQYVRIFFDSTEARDTFFDNIDKSAMYSNGDGYNFSWAFREDGKYFIQGDYCPSERSMRKCSNNSIEFN